MMNIIKYNPLNDYLPSTFGSMIENMLDSNAVNLTPETDIIKSEDELNIQMSVPGFSKDAFELHIDDSRLTISGERVLDEKLNYTQRESRFGSFKKSFKLGDFINTDNINATYENGILSISLPIDKKKTAKKSIKVS